MRARWNTLPAGLRAAIYMCLSALTIVAVLGIIVLIFVLIDKYFMWLLAIAMIVCLLVLVVKALMTIYDIWSGWRNKIKYQDIKRKEHNA